MATYNVGYNAAGTLLDFATINDAYVGASAGDTLTLWYSDAQRNPFWIAQINGGSATAKNLNLIGGLDSQKIVIIFSFAPFYSWLPTTSGNSLTIRNITFRWTGSTANSYGLKFDGTTSGNTAVVDSCRFIGGPYYGIQAYAAYSQTIKNCFFNGVARPVLGDGDSLVYLHNCTMINCTSSINLQYSGEIINCVFINSGTTQSFGAGVTAAYNVSTGNAPGTDGLSNAIYDELRFWQTDLGGLGLIAPQIFPDSALAFGGTPITGITSDIDGLAYATGVTPRGCSMGRDILPSRGRVLSTETYNGAAPLSGLFINADPAYYLLGYSWGAGGTSYDGEYVCGDAPDAPFITSTATASGAVTLTIDCGMDNTAYAYYRPASQVSSWVLGGTSVGPGDIEISSLIDGSPSEFIAVASAAGAWSLPSDTVTLIPNGTTADMEIIMNAVAAAITAAGLSSYSGTAVTAEVRNPPIVDHDESLACLVCEAGEEVNPEMSGVNTGVYRVAVRIFERLPANAASDAATLSKERVLIQSIRRLFPGRRLTGMSDVFCMSETGAESIPPDMLREENVIATELTFEFRKRHIRGA